MTTSMPSSDTWVGTIFWVVVAIGVGVSFYVKQDRAEIFLDVSTQPELISGTVTFEGAPVRGGVVRVAVTDVRNQKYLAGKTLSVGEDGKFTTQGQPSLGIGMNDNPLSVTAVFRGTLVEKKDDPEIKRLSGESTLYINAPPPLGVWFLWGVIIATVLMLALQLVLFTGRLGPGKARWLFILMYFFTFFSLALPIAVSLILAGNDYIVEAMENSPIGLVRARTKVLSEPQWLINIGGTVVPPKEAGPPEATEAGGVPSAVGSESSGRLAATVEGGVAVPFYVVLLAMFGAGINMTLKVPEIQRSYEDVQLDDDGGSGSSWFNPITAAGRWLRGGAEAPPAGVPRKTAGDIRRDLIENYMYLLSAPLLAIAMYYLLQILAEQVTQPVLVLMAFATGLVSKAVVGGIIDFAETKLVTDKRWQEQAAAEVATRAADAKASQAVAEAAVKAADESRARQAEAEAAATAAVEAARKAKQKQADLEAAAGGGEATPAETETAKEEAEKARRDAAAKQVELEDAVKAVAKATQESEAKQAEAVAAMKAAQEARAKQAETAAATKATAKQAEARAAAEATEEAAKVATEKQAEAEVAVQAAVQPGPPAAEAPEATPPQGETPTKPMQEVQPPGEPAPESPKKA